MALPEELDKQMDLLRDQGYTITHLHEVGDDCDERCVPHQVTEPIGDSWRK